MNELSRIEVEKLVIFDRDTAYSFVDLTVLFLKMNTKKVQSLELGYEIEYDEEDIVQ